MLLNINATYIVYFVLSAIFILVVGVYGFIGNQLFTGKKRIRHWFICIISVLFFLIVLYEILF